MRLRQGRTWKKNRLVLPSSPTRGPPEYALPPALPSAASETQQRSIKSQENHGRKEKTSAATRLCGLVVCVWTVIVCVGSCLRNTKQAPLPKLPSFYLPLPRPPAASLFLWCCKIFSGIKQEHQPNVWTSPFPFIRRMHYFKLPLDHLHANFC